MNKCSRSIARASLAIAFAATFAYAQDSVLCGKNHYILTIPGMCIGPAVPAAFTGTNPWTAIGPDGANVLALSIDPRTPATVFAGTAGAGALKSADGGAHWAPANRGLPTLNVGVVAIDPTLSSTLYAGTDAGVFKSIDGGQNWVAASTGLQGTPRIIIRALAIDPASPATLYAATPRGLYKSTDAAASWTSISAGLPGLVPRLIRIDPAAPSTVYISADGTGGDYGLADENSLFKSTDGGTTWSKIYAAKCGWNCDTSVTALAIDLRSPSTLYAAVWAVGMVRSEDGGASWSNVPTPEYFSAIEVDPAVAGTVTAGTFSGKIFRSADAGEHWTLLTDDALRFSVNVIAIPTSDTATVYVGGSTGIFQSSDGAQTWRRLTLGLAAFPVSKVVIDPVTPSTIYTTIGERLLKTTDGGLHWADSSLGLANSGAIRMMAIDPVSPSTLYAVSSSVFKSIDAGARWTPVLDGLNGAYGSRVMAIAPSRPSTLYVIDYNRGVMKSTDAGDSWTLVNESWIASTFSNPPLYVDEPSLFVDPTNDDIVYATLRVGPGNHPILLKSTDGAVHWRQLSNIAHLVYSITSLVIDPATPSTLYVSVDTEPDVSSVFKSIDGGQTWAAANDGLSSAQVSALALVPGSPSQIYAATPDGVFRSTAGAVSWMPLKSGLPNLEIFELAIERSGRLLRVATAGGLFEYRIPALTPGTVAIVEYYHAAFDHYFITASIAEIASLDNGTFAGWTRTGYEFNAYAAPQGNSVPVCRFFSTTFAPQSTHFYTPFAGECAQLRANHDWTLESADAFDIDLPAADGSCALDATPVYRLYNNSQGGAPNHRFTTDPGVRAQMLIQGWVREGIGADAVNMCSPL